MDASLNGPLGQISLTTATLTLGRVQDNQVVVNDSKASSHHAEIRSTVDGYTITDLGSTNGTFVNEQQLAPHTPRALNNADIIRIGDTRFTYTISGPAAIPPTIYAAPGNEPYAPTVAAPPPAYGNYTPPPVSPPVSPEPYPGYVPPPPQPSALPGQYPGYGVPPQPAYLPPAAPPFVPQPKKSLKWLWITLSIVGGALVLLCVGCTVFITLAASTPNKTLDAFCTGINNKQYHDAYLQLSTRVQSETPESTFTKTFTNISSCTHTSASEDGSVRTAKLTLGAITGEAANFNVNLIKDAESNWKIDSLQRPS